MISDLDIWRSAQVLIGRYGDDAALEAAGRADDMLDQGNIDGERIWLGILEKINELQRTQPSNGEPLH